MTAAGPDLRVVEVVVERAAQEPARVAAVWLRPLGCRPILHRIR